MTDRLYYNDTFTTEFTAQVVRRLRVNDHPALVLDRTFFYPTGGGQPNDTGLIEDAHVIDVQNADDGEVLHILSAEVSGTNVHCQVDWARRFDFMQHHTGQHMLTQAFVQVANANTVSFHLSADSVTIDLDTTTLSDSTLTTVEDLVNQVIYEDRPISAIIIDPNDAEGIRIRRVPEHMYTAGLRIIDIRNFDITACGGTHVSRTGQIGILKIVKLEKRGDKTRVEFRCGWRALNDYRTKHNGVTRVAADLNIHFSEIEPAVTRLRDDLKQTQTALKAASNQLLDFEAQHLLANAISQNGLRLVKAAFDNRDVGEVRALANRVTQSPGIIALLGTSGTKAQIFLARSANLTHDMNAALKSALAVLGDARGGGKPDFAQGGGLPADYAQILAALDHAEHAVLGTA